MRTYLQPFVYRIDRRGRGGPRRTWHLDVAECTIRDVESLESYVRIAVHGKGGVQGFVHEGRFLVALDRDPTIGWTSRDGAVAAAGAEIRRRSDRYGTWLPPGYAAPPSGRDGAQLPIAPAADPHAPDVVASNHDAMRSAARGMAACLAYRNGRLHSCRMEPLAVSPLGPSTDRLVVQMRDVLGGWRVPKGGHAPFGDDCLARAAGRVGCEDTPRTRRDGRFSERTAPVDWRLDPAACVIVDLACHVAAVASAGPGYLVRSRHADLVVDLLVDAHAVRDVGAPCPDLSAVCGRAVALLDAALSEDDWLREPFGCLDAKGRAVSEGIRRDLAEAAGALSVRPDPPAPPDDDDLEAIEAMGGP